MSCVVDPRAAGRMQDVWLLVTLRNYGQLNATFGPAAGYGADGIAPSVLRALSWICALQGAFIEWVGPDRLIVRLDFSGPELSEQEKRQLVEDWLVLLNRRYVLEDDTEVMPAVSVRLIEEVSNLGPGAEGEAVLLQDLTWQADYRRDIALAVALHDQLDKGNIEVARSTIVPGDDPDCVIYHELVLQLSAASPFPASDLPLWLSALQRLGMTRLLDHTLLHTALDQLVADPELTLACSISLQSAACDLWWSSLFERLQADPQLATRLVVQIAMPVPVLDTAPAEAFCQRLRDAGCSIAFDGFGSGRCNLDFLLAVKPAIVCIGERYAYLDTRKKTQETWSDEVLDALQSLCRAAIPHVVIIERREATKAAMHAVDGNWSLYRGRAGQHRANGQLRSRDRALQRVAC